MFKSIPHNQGCETKRIPKPGAHYMKKYGITRDDYDEMLQDQGHSCAICGIHQDNYGRRLSVDHCHKTNKVRGLLCSACNTGIGGLKDSVQNLQNAISYLEETGI